MSHPENVILLGFTSAAEDPQRSWVTKELGDFTAVAQEHVRTRIVYQGWELAHQPRRTLTPDVFDALAAQISTSVRTAERASASIGSLLQCAHVLMETAGRLGRAVLRTTVPVNALPCSDLRLKAPPLYVSVEGDEEDGFVAELVEVGAVGYGDTVPDAVDHAVRELCEIYREIGQATPESLGPRPQGWQLALRHLVEPVRG